MVRLLKTPRALDSGPFKKGYILCIRYIITANALIEFVFGRVVYLEIFNVRKIEEYSPEKRVRRTLSREGKLTVDLVYYEAGQGTPEHSHLKQDEVFYIVSGNGTMILDGNEISIQEKDIIIVPNSKTHGIRNDSNGRLVMLFVKNTIKEQ